jgi:hypothetical protein
LKERKAPSSLELLLILIAITIARMGANEAGTVAATVQKASELN